MALYLGHRRSVDLDWFTDNELPDPLALAEGLRRRRIPFGTGDVGPGALHGDVQGVRVSFLAYRYSPLAPSVPWAEMGCAIASLDDLACMKLAAAAQRGSRKGFLDVCALAVAHHPLPLLLDLYRRKYGVEDVGHVLCGLSYFDDAENEPLPVMLWPVSWLEVKTAVQGWIRAIAG